jgi:tRNA A-37 threonylcarbamoyl transferase component Bud32
MNEQVTRLTTALAGRYAIEREIGAGGMATVYLAEDLKHRRRVALKVLRPELSALLGAERFLREIEVTAGLQHPHILPLFDSGEADRLLYYVMPHVKGETLRQRLQREKQLSIPDAVRITTQVASALDYAHRQGLLHRDVKPENVLLEDGQALVADFGIALALRHAGGDRLTETGLSLGTPQYMSPEQATGDRQLDPRSDIYSLACVLYEMLAGEPPHTGPTIQAVLAKVVGDRPRPIAELRSTVPSQITHALEMALAKLPADRYATAAEFADALAAPLWFGPEVPTPPAQQAVRVAGRRWRFAAGAGLVLAGAALGVLAARAFAPRPPSRPRHWNIVLPDSAPLAFVGTASLGIGRQAVAVSRDGSRIVYVATRSASAQIFTRSLDADSIVALPGTEGAYAPFLSPDGKWVGFFVGAELRKAPVSGGPPVALAQVVEPYGAVWMPDDRIIVAENLGRRLSAVPTAGGPPVPLSSQLPVRVQTIQHVVDDWVLISSDRAMYLVSLNDGVSLALTASGFVPRDSARTADVVLGTNPVYVRSGHIVYLASGGNGTMMALPFDLKRRRVTGPPTPVMEGVAQEAEWGAGQFSVSDDGTIVFAPGVNAAVSRLVWHGRDGRLDTLPFAPRDYGTFRVSADGERVLAMVWPPSAWASLWVLDLRRGVASQVPGGDVGGGSFDWGEGDSTILFMTRPPTLGGRGVLVRQSPTSASGRDTISLGDWTYAKLAPDGRRVALYAEGGQSLAIGVLGDTGAAPVMFEAGASFPSFSPDGRWVAYTSRQAGLSQVVVTSVDRPAERYPVSDDSGEEPIWLSSGREIVYRNGRRWMVVNVELQGGLRIGRPRLLFEGPYHNVPGVSHDVSPDGQRDLLLLGPESRTATYLDVITDWFAELTGGNIQ